MKNKIFSLLTCMLLISAIACKKKKDPHIPPDVVFKTGTGYTSADAAVAQGDTLLVGIVATKTEDDLKSYNVSYAYDGATTTTTFFNYYLLTSEQESFSKDLQLPMRNQAGTERWVFSIVDRDGNITQKTLNITVQ